MHTKNSHFHEIFENFAIFALFFNRPWQSQPTKKGKGVVTKIDFTIGVLFYGPKEAPNTIR